MIWRSRARQKPTEWHLWFAWHPVRIPRDRYVEGIWVWLQPVERMDTDTNWDGHDWLYRLPTGDVK